MILAVDIGNTSIKGGIFDGDDLVGNFRIKTSKNKSSDEYFKLLNDLIVNKYIDGAIISSVVPSLTHEVKECLKKILNIEALIVSKEIKTKMAIKLANPNELGSDMLCGAIGARKIYGNSTLIADLGTATKIYVVNKNGDFIGGMVACGMRISLDSLVSNTAMLMDVPLEVPSKVIGTSTRECLQSGVVLGQAYMIREFAEKMQKELGYKLNLVLTGGYGNIIKNELNEFSFDDSIVMQGLNAIYKLNVYEK